MAFPDFLKKKGAKGADPNGGMAAIDKMEKMGKAPAKKRGTGADKAHQHGTGRHKNPRGKTMY